MTRQDFLDEFRRVYYESWLQTWANTSWLGVPSEKPPQDFWVYQEIITELRPDFIVETGTRYGGSALFMATVCDALGHGQVITIDLQDLASGDRSRREHPRITYLHGSSTSPDILLQVRGMLGDASTVLVILDSDHGMTHVSDELRLYADFVTEGSYLIVEDTHLNGHPVEPGFGPGPWEAVDVFLATTPQFVPDRSREKFLLTFSPRGYLQRCAPDGLGRLKAAEAQIQTEREEILQLRAELAAARRRTDEVMEAVTRSSSWRLTAPLRSIAGLMSRKHG